MNQRLDKYILKRSLGRGSFAEVFLAEDTELGREVALKVMHPNLLSDPDFVRRFENDARAAANLDHPYIVTIHEIGRTTGRIYIAMQYCSGGTLTDRIKRDGPLPFDEAAKIITQIAGALDYAHGRGFIHRDIKPSNIFFDAQDNAILGDFGLVKSAEESIIAQSSVGGIVGTPAYIAPEVWGDKPASPQTDIYALGCVLYEMLTGNILFERSSTVAVMRAHYEPRKFPAMEEQAAPQAVKAIVSRAVSIEPERRYATAGEFSQALDQCRTQKAPTVVTLPRWIYAAGLGLLLLAILATGIVLLSNRNDERQPQIELTAIESVAEEKPVDEMAVEPTQEIVATSTQLAMPSLTPVWTPTNTTAPTSTHTPTPTSTATSTPRPTPSLVSNFVLCGDGDTLNYICVTSRQTFPSGTRNLYSSWESPNAYSQGYTFTRIWYRDGQAIHQISNVAGSNDRWTPINEDMYFVWLSAESGSGSRLFPEGVITDGHYKLVLVVSDQADNTLETQELEFDVSD